MEIEGFSSFVLRGIGGFHLVPKDIEDFALPPLGRVAFAHKLLATSLLFSISPGQMESQLVASFENELKYRLDLGALTSLLTNRKRYFSVFLVLLVMHAGQVKVRKKKQQNQLVWLVFGGQTVKTCVELGPI